MSCCVHRPSEEDVNKLLAKEDLSTEVLPNGVLPIEVLPTQVLTASDDKDCDIGCDPCAEVNMLS